MANIIHIDPASANDAVAKFQVGGLYEAPTGELYRYVKFVDNVTYAAGQLVQLASADGKSVTNDISGGSAIGSIPAGICLRVMTTGYYGFVLVRGYYSAVLTNGDDDIAAGDALIVGAADGVVDSAASPTVENYVGTALAADVDAANTVAAWVKVASI